MDEERQFIRTIEGLYSAALDDSEWSGALLRVAHFVGAHAAFHLASNPVTCEVLASHSVGIDPVANELLLGPMADKEIRMPPALRYPVGQVIVDRQLVDWRVFRRSEIYNELCKPYDVPNLMAVWLQKAPHAFVSLSVDSSERHGEFLAPEIERFSRLVPYLQRAQTFRQLMRQARQARQITDQILEFLPFGVVTLDSSGAVLTMTSTARRLAMDRNCFRYAGGRIRATDAMDDQQLQRLIHRTLNRNVDDAEDGSCTIRRVIGRPLIAIAIPIMSEETTLSLKASCLLLFIDPDRKFTATTQLLRQRLNLTLAEARLAARIFQGRSLAEASRDLGLSYNTCKSQLKAIYDKTDCASQVELVKKVMTIAALGIRSPSTEPGFD